jgi:hypothetical protein
MHACRAAFPRGAIPLALLLVTAGCTFAPSSTVSTTGTCAGGAPIGATADAGAAPPSMAPAEPTKVVLTTHTGAADEPDAGTADGSAEASPPFTFATRNVTLRANVDASARSPFLPWDPTNPAATSSFSTSMLVYDSLGSGHALNIYFVVTATAFWDVHVLVEGGELMGGTFGTNVEIGSDTLRFTSAGRLNSVDVYTPISANFVGALPNQDIAMHFGTPIALGGTGLDGVTSFVWPNAVLAQLQDGSSR